MKTIKWGLFVLLTVIIASCYPSYEKDIEDHDVVITFKLSDNFDDEEGQTAFKSFFIADTIMHLADSLKEKYDPKFPRDFDEHILSEVARNYTEKGYTRITDTLGATPDLLISVSALAVKNTVVYTYYPDYWWGGGYWGNYWDDYWWGYPGYPYWPAYPVYSVYTYNKGSLYIDMVSYHSQNKMEEVIEAEWKGIINGLLYEGNSPTEERITGNIDLLFDKATYLQVK